MVESKSILHGIFYFIYYRTFRKWMPRRLAIVNGEYTVYAPKLFDPLEKDEISNHEEELIDGIEMVVEESDDVVIVGGGLGVSTLTAAELVGPDGNVQTFEASVEIAKYLSETVSINDVGDRVNVFHGAVGPTNNLWGRRGERQSIAPEELPPCDVLILDCEGAEKEIIENTDEKPNAIVVEYHSDLGVSERDARDALKEFGYDIIDHSIEINDRGIGILTAIYES